MKVKLSKFVSASWYEKYNFISNVYAKIITYLIYRQSFKKLGRKCIIKNPLLIKYPHCIEMGNYVFIRDNIRLEAVPNKSDTKTRIIIKDGVYIEQNCHITAAGELVIGSNTVMSFGVMITDIDHEYQQIGVNILRQPLLVKKTKIGDNCFIGAGAKVQAGTILGKQCIIGTNAVVRGTFPDYCVIVGIPAKIVKRYNSITELWEKTNDKGEFLNAL